MTTEQFIQEHLHDDVRDLALQRAKFPDVNIPYALDQIKGWQTARQKLPTWADIEGIIYPPQLSMEQCSSEATAVYKANLARRLLCSLGETKANRMLVDLTGGFGVDFVFMAEALHDDVRLSVYVERQENLCAIATHNFHCLQLRDVEVVCADGIDYLQGMPAASIVFMDPARRDTHGGRTYAIKDCTPDVLSMEEQLLEKADFVILKLSPMLDVTATVEALGRENVREVHVVSVGNECKELLVTLSRKVGNAAQYYCVNDEDMLSFGDQEFRNSWSSDIYLQVQKERDYSLLSLDNLNFMRSSNSLFLYEPNASIMKMGCFGIIRERYGVKALGANSHLFVSQNPIPDFPGRKFQVKAVSTMNKKDLRRQLQSIQQANITTRNFPLSAKDLRKRLALKDGGDTYIFATTNHLGEHILFICGK